MVSCDCVLCKEVLSVLAVKPASFLLGLFKQPVDDTPTDSECDHHTDWEAFKNGRPPTSRSSKI